MVKYSILVIAMFLLNMPLLGREKILINFDWKYKVGDHAKAELRDFNDTDWQHINLPHDASIYGPFVKDTLGGKANNGYRPRNIGWYRKFIFFNTPFIFYCRDIIVSFNYAKIQDGISLRVFLGRIVRSLRLLFGVWRLLS